MKPTITPGRLYAKLTREFRQVCCSDCSRCVLPVPARVDESRGGPNWDLGALPRECDPCANAIRDIVRRNQQEYDLLDPVSPSSAPRNPPRPSGPLH